MVSFKKGERYINNKTLCSIVDIKLENDTNIYVFNGNLSPNDILIKYTQRNSRIRTPKHIHWVVDLLIKREHNQQLINQFLQWISDRWREITPLNDRSYDSIVNSLFIYKDNTIKNKYVDLDQYGYYKMDFLIVLMELLILQEKTNRSDAYMFNNVVKALQRNEDLFSIISTATHR